MIVYVDATYRIKVRGALGRANGWRPVAAIGIWWSDGHHGELMDAQLSTEAEAMRRDAECEEMAASYAKGRG